MNTSYRRKFYDNAHKPLVEKLKPLREVFQGKPHLQALLEQKNRNDVLKLQIDAGTDLKVDHPIILVKEAYSY